MSKQEQNMKRLLLMRHGQAGWESDEQNDFDRFLTAQGQADSKAIARWMAANDLVPDTVIYSEAVRTTQTWDVINKTTAKTTTAQALNELYLASPGALLSNIEKLSNETACLLVIGHNPGLESLARLMSGPGSHTLAAEDLRLGFPPAGLAVIELNGESWRTMSAEGGCLTAFIRPQELAAA